mmetsp:Transcript_17829/g.37285  ORF Transcript_17829/g.37285 Transcript_17829/m.37285 type:complete len:356 (-) Transcript_17829:108-1175(-)
MRRIPKNSSRGTSRIGILCWRAAEKTTRTIPITSASASSSSSSYTKTSTKRFLSSNTSGNNRLNLSLVGPPGSGKGSYGKHFAKTLKVPLVTVSDLLRTFRPDLIDSLSDGKLVDDAVVGETVLRGLSELNNDGSGGSTARRNNNSNNNNDDDDKQTGGYILDGFPRTIRQVALMEETWPESLRISSVIHLEVPDHVCESKLLGRRNCSRCGKSYNVNGVFEEPWILPPHLPREGQVCTTSTNKAARVKPKNGFDYTGDNASCNWTVQRDDDTPEIVWERLKIYHQNADPILEYFNGNRNNDNNDSNKYSSASSSRNASKNVYRLLTLRPYRGFDDLPILIDKLHSHVGCKVEQR